MDKPNNNVRLLSPTEITRFAKIVVQNYRGAGYHEKLSFLSDDIKRAVVCQLVLGVADQWESTNISSAAVVGIRDEAYLLLGLNWDKK